ncbi:ATP-dependent helicase [Lysinibacillus boronitolerans]|uniref:ATP-dependent helicase n=1 Tax=Lysinibacillus TaxID=400634 RepID=UPI000372814A|nr:ATP-dependent helicase [Lysinibacillus boronitolerans]
MGFIKIGGKKLFCIIDSEFILEDFEKPFKVIAGPGAGKTHWLVKNIKHLLLNSPKMHRNSKIACITYTNVGVEEINKKLDSKSNKVEVCTIHAFLYKNIIRPYVYLLKDEETNEVLVNTVLMKGHSDNVPSFDLIRKWREADLINYLNWRKDTSNRILNKLSSLQWKFEDEDFSLISKDYTEGPSIRKEDLIKYKKYCWKRGIIHHDDVLYLSYKLLKEYPGIATALSSVFTYIVLDEFQDTSDIQTEIIKILFESGSVVGTVGDSAQSIFKFQGAKRQAFIDFNLANQHNYIIRDNRRCGNKIVNLLNVIRNDMIQQECVMNSLDNYVYIYQYADGNLVKPIIESFEAKRTELNLDNDFSIIAFKNEHVNLMKTALETNDIWGSFKELDADRCTFLMKIFKGYRYYLEGFFDLAINEIENALIVRKNGKLIAPFNDSYFDKSHVKGLAVNLLEFLLTQLQNDYSISLQNFYNKLCDFMKNKSLHLSKMVRNPIKDFAVQTKVDFLINTVKLSEIKKDVYRTIHGVKGAEFQSVLLYLDGKNDLVSPNIDATNESTRIFYVGCSRAKQLLFIATPILDDQEKQKLVEMYGDFIEFA